MRGGLNKGGSDLQTLLQLQQHFKNNLFEEKRLLRKKKKKKREVERSLDWVAFLQC